MGHLKVLVLLDNPFVNDRRVIEEVKTLAEADYTIEVICLADDHHPVKEQQDAIAISRIIPLTIFDPKNLSVFKKLAGIIASRDFDVLHCHDQFMLHLGSLIKKIKPSTILIYDSHELFHAWPLNISDFKDRMIYIKSVLVRKYFVYREKRNSKYIDYLVTVNKSLADNLKAYFNLKNEVTILRNIPKFQEVGQQQHELRKQFRIPPEQHILVFIGANIYPRTLNLEQVITAFGNSLQVAVVFVSGGGKLKQAVVDFVALKRFKNIFFHDFIPNNMINQYLCSCTAGLLPTWNKADLSYWYALDNKLFEYMMAEIPILATAQPEYKSLIEKYNLGVCVDPAEMDAFERGFNKLIANYAHYKQQIKAAKKELNWENEKTKLVDLYRQTASR